MHGKHHFDNIWYKRTDINTKNAKAYQFTLYMYELLYPNECLQSFRFRIWELKLRIKEVRFVT
jgi:hypothetical protein